MGVKIDGIAYSISLCGMLQHRFQWNSGWVIAKLLLAFADYCGIASFELWCSRAGRCTPLSFPLPGESVLIITCERRAGVSSQLEFMSQFYMEATALKVEA